MARPATTQLVDREEYARRLRALLGPGGLGAGFPRKRRDLWILLHAIAQRIAPSEALGEIEATGRLGRPEPRLQPRHPGVM